MSSDELRQALESALNAKVDSLSLTRGGDINDAFVAVTNDGPVFVKTSSTAQPGMFSDEAAGLVWLAESGDVRTPAVAGLHDPSDDDGLPRLLALEWIDADSAGLDFAGSERLGRGLAAMHGSGAPAFGYTPRLEETRGSSVADANSPMRFNDLSLPNEPYPTFAEFYARNRILPLADQSHAAGRLDAEETATMHRLAERLPELVGPPEPPARTHGDLWIGNVVAGADGQPWLIDPVAHGGHREIDLANLRVFGSPAQRCFDAYAEHSPLADGHEERVPLWQLAMILLHVYLFGRLYAAQATAIARRYV